MRRAPYRPAWPNGKKTTPACTTPPRCGGSWTGASSSWFAWTPSLYLELGEALGGEELSLIEAGSIQATGFQYVGERSG